MELDEGKFARYRGTAFLICVLITLYLLQTFILPMIMGAIFAIVLYPIFLKVQKIEIKKRRMGPQTAGITLTLGFLLAFLLPFSILVFAGANAALKFVNTSELFKHTPPSVEAPASANTEPPSVEIPHQDGTADVALADSNSVAPVETPLASSSWLEPILQNEIFQKLRETLPLSTEQLKEIGLMAGQKTAGVVSQIVQNLLTQLPNSFISAIIILLTIYFSLLEGPVAVEFIRRNSIFGRKHTNKLIDVMNVTCHSVIVASILSGIVQALIISIACMITGKKDIVLISLITFLFSFVPLIGTAPVSAFFIVSGLLQSDTLTTITFIITSIVVGLSDNFVRPYVLAGGAKIHPLLAFVSAFGAFNVIGFYGLFLGPVMAGLVVAMVPLVLQSEN